MKKTILLLILLIVLPLAFIAWYSVRLEAQQQALFKHQVLSLIESQLTEYDQLFQQHFLRLESALNEEIERLEASETEPKTQFNALINSSPYIENLFLIGKDGTTTYPSLSSNKRSQAFLASTQTLRNNLALFANQKTDSDTSTAIRVQPSISAAFSAPLEPSNNQPKLKISNRSTLVDNKTDAPYLADSTLASSRLEDEHPLQDKDAGWIAWYNNATLQHIYWYKDSDDNILGFSLNSSRLLSDLINLLPDEQQAKQINTLANASIRLINSRGENLYEWGGATADVRDNALKVIALGHPLGSWKLEYRSATLATPTSNWLSKLLIFILISLALAVLAWIIYREQSRATRLAEQRVNFVNQVSHELKTPLTNVRMYAEMLSRKIASDDEKSQRYVSVINHESQRLSRLIDNVLSFSKFGRTTNKLDFQAAMLGASIQKTIDAFKPALAQTGMAIHFENNCDKPVRFNAQSVEQILNNLLSNCEKYASNSHLISIKCWQEHEYSFVQINDQGPGIRLEYAEKIFQPFYRLSNKLTDGVTGTGIGLSISRELARQHGGDLRLVVSDEGACFQLKIHTPSATEKNHESTDR